MEEDQCPPFFWESCFQYGTMMEEFRQALFYTTLELKTAVAASKAEIARRDSDLLQLEEELSRAFGERDTALSLSRRLQHENLVLREQLDRNQTCKQDPPTSRCEGEEAAVKEFARSPSPRKEVDLDELGGERRLPEKGKLLQAVMEAGPILQTLMLAWPLPRWQHPPPQLDSAQIPPVGIPKKRGAESNHPSNESGSPESPQDKRIKLLS